MRRGGPAGIWTAEAPQGHPVEAVLRQVDQWEGKALGYLRGAHSQFGERVVARRDGGAGGGEAAPPPAAVGAHRHRAVPVARAQLQLPAGHVPRDGGVPHPDDVGEVLRLRLPVARGGHRDGVVDMPRHAVLRRAVGGVEDVQHPRVREGGAHAVEVRREAREVLVGAQPLDAALVELRDDAPCARLRRLAPGCDDGAAGSR
eukprot:gene3256-biopygen7401